MTSAARPFRLALLCCSALGACGGGDGGSSPIGGAAVVPELLACRARLDSPFQFAEIALRSAQNLGTARVADRTGTERRARIHPDGNTVVFARERDNADPDSRELFTSTLDGTRAELRLTQDNRRDDEPCWSPDGTRILFVSERQGAAALWTMAQDGTDPRPLLAVPMGESDGEPDWHRTSDEIVFSRRDAQGRHRLHRCAGNGTGILPLTDGGAATGAGSGDRAPAFSPDGRTVAFVRVAPGRADLCLVDVASGIVVVRHSPNGMADLPRFSSAGDRIFFGLAEPAAGRGTLRLASIPVAGGPPTLVWPDERWRLEGIDVLPALGAAPAAAAPVLLDVQRAEVQLAFGSALSGSRSQLVGADDDELRVATQTFENHEVAGINCRFDLPVALAADVLELRVRAVARVLRTGGDTALRMSIYNPVDERFDTAVELAPQDTSAQTMSFATTSLRHVTRERQLRVTVIAEVAAGDRTELRIDQVEVQLVARATPP